jgi:hypothetical protein
LFVFTEQEKSVRIMLLVKSEDEETDKKDTRKKNGRKKKEKRQCMKKSK